jgi:hypothetical protein
VNGAPAIEIVAVRPAPTSASTIRMTVAGPVPTDKPPEMETQSGRPVTDQAQDAPVWMLIRKLSPAAVAIADNGLKR